MLLIHKNSEEELLREDTAFLRIFEKINELIVKKDTIFSHLVVNGVDVYEDLEAYINKRLPEIMRVEIVTKSATVMIYETMESIHAYLTRAIPALKELVEESFESFDGETWNGIDQLAEGMQWILKYSAFVTGQRCKPGHWDDIEKDISRCESSFKQLMEAVESEDTVFISDILSYEIVPAYVELKSDMEKSLQDKEFFEDVH